MQPITALLIGAGVSLTGVFGVLSRHEREREWVRRARRRVAGMSVVEISKKQSVSIREELRQTAQLLGRPELADVWLRTALLASVAPIGAALLFREGLWLLALPLPLLGLRLYAKGVKKVFTRKMQAQTRVAQMMLAFLLRAGDDLPHALELLERRMPDPFATAMRSVNVKRRYSTLPEALMALAEATGVGQLSDFATLIGESDRHGTPVAQSILQGLALDGKLRDAQATRRFGEAQLQMTVLTTALIAVPGFGFTIFAMLSYMLHLFSGIAL